MNKSLASIALSVFMLAGLAGPAVAFPISSLITGGDMAGIEVEAFFGDASETAIWATDPDDASAGEAGTDNWRLRQSGDTFGEVVSQSPDVFTGLWTFSNLFDGEGGLFFTSFVVRGLPGNVVFDTILSPGKSDNPTEPEDEGTPGSGQGRPLTPNLSGAALTAFNAVNANPYSDLYSSDFDDLYGTMTVNFAGDGLAPGESLEFFADTDAIAVPSPASLVLFGAGLIALVGIRRRAL